MIKGWQKEATQDPAKIDKWVKQFGDNINFGIPTGELSGIIVVDIDDKNGKKGSQHIADNFEEEVWLQGEGSNNPFTFMQATPSGGRHFFFKYEKDKPVRNGTDIFGPMSGVDIRGNGGYVLIAPSKGYKVIGTKFSGMQNAPQELYTFLEKKKGERKSSTVATKMDDEEVAFILSKLNPEDDEFTTRDGWQEIMRAVHAATGGEDWGKELFIQWSLRHPGPWDKDVETEIERDWPSYDPNGATTAGTLVYWANKKNVGCMKASQTLDLTTDKPEGTEADLQIKNHKLKTNVYNINELLSASLVPDENNSLIENELRHLFVHNELTQETCFFKSPPWNKRIKVGKPLHDSDITNFRSYLSSSYNVDFAKDVVIDGCNAFARNHPNHPIKNYLEGLEWDGVERLDTWLIDACGTPDDEYHRAVSSKVLISAVARIYKPGVHMDTMLVLEGDQGCRKSSLVRVLGHHDREDRGWYAAPSLDIKNLGSSTSAITDCMGSWVIELEEMASVTKADEKNVKKFLSTREDKATLKYEKFSQTFKRQFIFIGTINPYGSGKYIRDLTGARRFWPVTVNKSELHPIDVDAVDAILDQLYAEAVKRFKDGEKFHLEGEALRQAKIHQAARMMSRDGMEEIRDFFVDGPGKDLNRVHTRDIVKEIWPGQEYRQYRFDDVTHYLSNNGWEKKKSLYIEGKTTTGFQRIIDEDEID